MTALVVRADANRLPLADATVDLVVTSPPYFGLRSYQDGGEHYAGQVGDEPTPQEFVAALLAVTAECVRVLKPSGSIWVNLGDSYFSGKGAPGKTTVDAKNEGRTARRLGGNPLDGPSFGVQRKSLVGVPWRYALGCIDQLGLILRAEVIWAKPNGLPESVTDRVRRSHEQWFHFTKQPHYFAAVDEIREEHQATKQGRSTEGWRPGPPGQNRGTAVGREHDDGSPLRHFALSSLGKLPGSVWEVSTQPLIVPASLGVDHFAAFPTEWPRRIVQGWSPAAVCDSCNTGLRPVAPVVSDGGPVARAHRHLPGYSDPAGEGRRDVRRVITGYSCDCEDLRWTLDSTGTASARTTAPITPTTTDPTAAAAEPHPSSTPAATATARPAIVLDCFGGTGTTALVASTLGRVGISCDLSHDYSRLAQWRTTDPGERAKAMRVDKPPVEVDGQADLFGEAS